MSAIIESLLIDPLNLSTEAELSAQETQCTMAFERSDRDGNGVLTFDEIFALCASMGLPLEEGEDEMLRKMDKDGSGTLEKGEWVVWWLKRVSRMPNPEAQQEVIAAHTFNQFDIDDSGTISASEFKTLCSHLGTHFNDREIREALQLLDSDRSGTVERDEFIAWWISRAKSAHMGGVVGAKLQRLASKAAQMFDTDIHTAVWKGQTELVHLFIQSDPRLARAADPSEHGDAMTPLHYAAYQGNTELCAALITAAGPAGINQKTDSGFSPLFYACQQGHMDIAQLLLDAGADPTIAGAVLKSDPDTGDVTNTGRVLCPVDHCRDYPLLRSMFSEHTKCSIPEMIDPSTVHVSLSQSGLLMITHPATKRLSALPINAWHLRVVMTDRSVMEFDVPVTQMAIADKRFEYVISKTELITWIKTHRKKVIMTPEAEPEPDAEADAKEVSDKRVEGKDEEADLEAEKQHKIDFLTKKKEDSMMYMERAEKLASEAIDRLNMQDFDNLYELEGPPFPDADLVTTACLILLDGEYKDHSWKRVRKLIDNFNKFREKLRVCSSQRNISENALNELKSRVLDNKKFKDLLLQSHIYQERVAKEKGREAEILKETPDGPIDDLCDWVHQIERVNKYYGDFLYWEYEEKKGKAGLFPSEMDQGWNGYVPLLYGGEILEPGSPRPGSGSALDREARERARADAKRQDDEDEERERLAKGIPSKEEQEKEQKSALDAKSAMSRSTGSFSGGGGRRKASRQAKDEKEKSQVESGPKYKWVVTAIEPLLDTVQIAAVNAMGIGEVCSPLPYEWLSSAPVKPTSGNVSVDP